MKLPWRTPELGENPWDEEIGLSGWTPGTSDKLDMFAMMVSLARAQWTLAEWLQTLSRSVRVLSGALMICSILWVFVAFTQVGTNLFHWWQ